MELRQISNFLCAVIVYSDITKSLQVKLGGKAFSNRLFGRRHTLGRHWGSIEDYACNS